MTNAYRDENNVPTLIGTLNTNGTSIVRILVVPTTHLLKVSDGSSGSDNGNNGNNANKDENSVPVFMAVSSVDGKTPVEVYTDASGNLLVNSN